MNWAFGPDWLMPFRLAGTESFLRGALVIQREQFFEESVVGERRE
jgi:hypothetical protein